MANKKQYNNAFSRVFTKVQAEENKTEVNKLTNQVVNLSEDKTKEEPLSNLEEQNVSSKEIGSKNIKQVKKLTNKLVNETRTVKGFQLTAKSQKLIELIARMEGKKEYEIVEQGIEALLLNNPKLQSLSKMI
jgi:hypothetical protein